MILLFSVTLVACGQSDDAQESREGPAMTAEAISSNDVTAIDAVTGEAANIAADVVLDANLLAEGNESANGSAAAERPRRGGASSAPARPRSAPPASETNQAAPEPESNAAE
jgi:hypothetical protein